jgi:hypothetical protein
MVVATHEGSAHVLKTPLWMTVIRGLIVLISLVILGMAGHLIHGAYLDEFGLAVATAVLTWLAVAYILVSEKVPSAHQVYHIIAVIAVDAFMAILWLATFAATAARRAKFVEQVNVSGCFNDGSMVSSNHCFVDKRSIDKRAVLLFKLGQDLMAAIAGLGALLWVLFLVCLVWESIKLFKGRKEGLFLVGSGSDEHQMQVQSPSGPVVAGAPGVGPEKVETYQNQQPIQQQQQVYPNGPHQPPVAAGQYGYAPVQGQYQPSPVSPQPSSTSPAPAPGPYPPPQELYAQNQQQQQQHHGQYPPQGYPAQPYPHYGSPSPVSGYQNELDGQHNQQYAQHPSTSPPPQQPYAGQ